jgi:hypothetical protein
MSEEFRKRLPLMSTLCCDSIAHNSRRAPPLWRFFTDGLRRGIRKDQLVLVLLRSLQPQKSEVLTPPGRTWLPRQHMGVESIMASGHRGPNRDGVNANYGTQNVTQSTFNFNSGGMPNTISCRSI